MPSSPSAEVSLQVAANSAAAQLEMFTRKFKQMQKDMANATKQTAKESKEAGWSFSNWSSDIVKASVALYAMHAPIKAVQSAVQMVRDEIENTIQISEQFKNRQVPYQQQLMNMVFNLPANENAEQLKSSLHQMMMKSKISDKAALLRIVESAASSTVDMPYLERAQIAIDVAETRPDLMGMDQNSLEQLTKSVVYNQKAFQDLGSTTAAQQGMLQAAKSAALIQDNEAYYKHLGMLPGQVRNSFGQQYGQIETLLFTSALNIAAGDTEGPMTATQVNNFYADLKNKFASIPEMRDKTLVEQRAFLRGNDPRAERVRSELLAMMEERAVEGLSEEDKMTIELANLGDKESLQKLKDRPDLTGRSKTKFAVMQFIQPEGVGNDSSSFNINTVFDALLKGAGPNGGELPIVLDAKGRIDDAASYRKAEQLLKQRVAITQDSSEFKVSNLNTSLESAGETLSQNATGRAIYGLREKVIDTMLKAGGSATYYKNEGGGGWFSPFRWSEMRLDKDDPVAVSQFFKATIRSQMQGMMDQRMNEVTPVYPEWISKAKRQKFTYQGYRTEEFFDDARLKGIKDPYASTYKLIQDKGFVPKEYQQMYGLSDKTLKDLETLYKLYADFERLEKANGDTKVFGELLKNIETNSNSGIPNLLDGSRLNGGNNQGAVPQVRLDDQSLQAVRQVFESVNVLLGIFGPAMSGDRPISIKDASKPRTEPAKGDWRP